MRKTLLSAALLSAFAMPSISQAEEATSPHSFSANVGLYSQYIFRGLTQTDTKPALQGGFDYGHDSGLYAGVWASNISWLTDAGAYTNSSIEIDVYGGYASEFGDTGIGYDVGILQYLYPGDRASGTNNAETTELYGALSYGWASMKYSYAISDTFGFTDSEGSWYLEAGVDVPLPYGLTASAHIGRQEFDGSGNDASDYTDWKLGLSKAWDSGYELGAFYTDTNNPFAVGPGYDDVGEEEFTVYVSKSF